MMNAFHKPSTRCVRALTAGTTAALVVGGSVLAAPAAFAAAPLGTGGSLLGGSVLPVSTVLPVGAVVGGLVGGVKAPITGTAAGALSGTGVLNGSATPVLSGTGLLEGSTVPVLNGTGVLGGSPISVPVTVPVTVGNGTTLDPSTTVSPTTSPSTGLDVSPTTGTNLSPTTGTNLNPTTGGVTVSPTTGTATTAPSTGSSTSTSTTTTTTAPAPAASDGVPAPAASGSTPAPSSSAPAPSASAAARTLARIDVTRSVSTVYPRKDGYRDSVRFGVRPVAVDGAPIGVRGTAVLRKGSAIVKTWTLAPSTATVTWNGRRSDEVVPGSYTLTVSAGSADGATRTGSTSVRVSAERLVTRTVVTRSLTVPAKVRAGIRLAAARVQVSTTAKASSTGRLQLHLGATTSVIAVRSGAHRSSSILVPSNSAGVRFTKQWKAGQVQLKALAVRWTYKQLV